MKNNNDLFEDFMEYKISSTDTSSNSSSPEHKTGGTRIPTWLFVIALVGIVSGTWPINGFTVVLSVVFAIVIFVRILGS